jgi:hypothetical protein
MQKNYFFIFFNVVPYKKKFKSFKMVKIYIKILFCNHYFSPLNTFLRKGKDPEGPKTYGSYGPGSGSGSGKLIYTVP